MMIQERDHADLAAWKCWTVAFLATAAATALEMLFLRIEANCALLPPVVAVVLIATVAGLRPSLGTLALNLLIAEYIVIPSYNSFTLWWVFGAIRLLALTAVASLSWYSG